MKQRWFLLLMYAFLVSSHVGADGPLSLQQYLQQVKSQSLEAKVIQESLVRAETRLDEADVPLSSEFYATYGLSDDRNEATNPFSPKRIKGTSWRAGVRDRTSYGLSTDVYFDSSHVTMPGFAPPFSGFYTDYFDSKLGVEITQSLWRDSFGQATRADLEAKRSMSRMEVLKQKFELKNLLLKAENTYWSLVSYNQIVKLQEENVERARKLRDWMRGRAKLRLVDDVESLQAEASFDSRELELMSSVDERAALMRQFNTIRGLNSDAVGPLGELPTNEMLLRVVRDKNQRMTREDFRMVYEQALQGQAMAKASTSKIAPQLDLVAGLAANGLDVSRNTSYQEAQAFENPTMTLGVRFSVPLDYSLIRSMRRSYKAEARAAEQRAELARFNEERAWDDLLKQKQEVQRRFEKAVTLENIQTELVKKERQRLLNGRTTTFQAITFEQNLALAQIQRVKSQLALLQIHNLLKTFEVQP